MTSVPYRFSASGTLVLLWLLASPVLATEITVDHDAGRYRMQFMLETPLSAQEVYARLTNYNHLNRINPSILESRLLGVEPGGAKRVYSMIRGCVLFFCENMRRVERVVENPSGLIISEILPELSDFKFGWARWQISATANGAHIFFQAEVEPAFQVPALLGTWLVKTSMQNELGVTAALLRGEADEDF